MNDQDKPEIKQSLIEYKRLTMFATVDGQTKKNRLLWSYAGDGYVRLTAFVGDYSLLGKAVMITVSLAQPDLMILLNEIEETVNREVGYKNRVEVTQPNEERTVIGISYGKDKDGLVWVGLSEKDKNNVAFKYEPPDWTVFYDGTGKKLSRDKCSELYCKGHVQGVRQLTMNMMSMNLANGVGLSVGGTSGNSDLPTSEPTGDVPF